MWISGFDVEVADDSAVKKELYGEAKVPSHAPEQVAEGER